MFIYPRNYLIQIIEIELTICDCVSNALSQNKIICHKNYIITNGFLKDSTINKLLFFQFLLLRYNFCICDTQIKMDNPLTSLLVSSIPDQLNI